VLRKLTGGRNNKGSVTLVDLARALVGGW
jgi:hypothetical protein